MKWNGALYKEQIELDFFNALLPLLIFGDSAIPDGDSPPIACSKKQLDDYHFVHGQLESLTELSKTFAREVSESRPVRAPLVIPSGDQISHIPDIVDARVFSIAQEIDSIRAELARARMAAAKIKQTAEVGRSTNLPIFFVASCAAVLLFVVQKVRRSS